jgi:hypothetical protein
MSLQSPSVGVLDIKNATLRVGKLEVASVQGIDASLNTFKANSILLFDDQRPDTTKAFTTTGSAVYNTSNISLASGAIYAGLGLPNAWAAEFEMAAPATGQASSSVSFEFYSTDISGGGGYKLNFDTDSDPQKIELSYDGTAITSTNTTIEQVGYRKYVVIYERGAISVSIDGTRYFYHNDIEREGPYVVGAGGFVRFACAGTDLTRDLRKFKISNDGPWNFAASSSDIAYLNGSVGIGTNSPSTALDVAGTITATTFSGSGSDLTNIPITGVTNLSSNVTRIEKLESNLISNVTRIENLESNLTANSTRITAIESGIKTFTGQKTFQDDVIMAGNLTVSGTTTVVDTTNLQVKDPIIELGKDNDGSPIVDLGLIMTRPSGEANVAMIYDESADSLEIGHTMNGAQDSTITMDTANALAVNIHGFLDVSSNLEIGTANLYVDTTTGNVGIGTTNPGFSLDVHGTANVGALTLTSVSGNGSGLTALNADNISSGTLTRPVDTTTVTIDDYLIHDGDADTKIGFPATDTFTVTTANSERMRVDSSGNVGIGTDSPTGFELYNKEMNQTFKDDLTNIHRNNKSYIDSRDDAAPSTLTQRYAVSAANNSGESAELSELVIGAAADENGTVPGSSFISFSDNKKLYLGSHPVEDFMSDWNTVSNEAYPRMGSNTFAPHMTLLPSGNVGIGTDSPLNILHLSSDNTTLDASDSATFDQYSLIIHNTRGTNSTNTELGLCFNHYDSFYPTGSRTPGAAITHERTDAWSKGKLHFKTKSGNTEDGSCDTRMTIDEVGNVGIGLTSPAKKLDVAGRIRADTMEIDSYIYHVGDSDTYFGFSNDDHFRIVEGGDIRFQVDSTGYIGIGLTTPSSPLHVSASTTSTHTMRITHNDTDATSGTNALLIDANYSGSDTFTSNKTNAGLYIDLDSSATGGGTVDEHRIYGILTDVRHSGDSDLVDGIYGYARSDHTSGTTTYLRAGEFVAVASGTGTNTNIYGISSIALKDGGSTGTTSAMYGVRGEVEVDAGTCTNAYGVQSHIDRDGGTLTTGYLYHGSYSGTVGTRWGIYLSGETKNYFSGNVGIGVVNPSQKLDVNGVIKNQNPSWNLHMLGGNPYPVTSGILQFNHILVPARNCNPNTSGGLTSKITITVAGRYYIGFVAFTEDNVVSNAGVDHYVRINGDGYVRNYHRQPVSNYSAMGGLGCVADLEVNDYVEIYSLYDVHWNLNSSFYGFMIG